MLFEIQHRTCYRYSCPVQLGEHLLRFSPMQRPGQQLIAYQLQIEPEPCGLEQFSDDWGNPTDRATFVGETDRLIIAASLMVATADTPGAVGPFGFDIPVDYAADSAVLAPFLEPLDDVAALAGFIEPLLRSAAGDGAAYLLALNSAVHGLYHQGVRHDGPPRRPAETLSTGEGVCRDLTVLFMACCRQVGIATRFVSGYQQGDRARQLRYLHAWPEAHIPGYGWQGLDPTHDCLVGGDHVAVAAAPTAAAVTPVLGGYVFNGPEVTSTLDVEILISTS